MRVTYRLGLVLFVAASVGACSALGVGAADTPTPSETADGHMASPSVGLGSAGGKSSTPTAFAACSALLDNVPSTQVSSGKATLMAAYDVSGAQLATYLERMHDAAGVGGHPSTWRDKSTQRVTMCLFDGDFETMTPGPPGHDTSASRVLVLIENGLAELWAIAPKEASAIPVTDPASLSE